MVPTFSPNFWCQLFWCRNLVDVFMRSCTVWSTPSCVDGLRCWHVEVWRLSWWTVAVYGCMMCWCVGVRCVVVDCAASGNSRNLTFRSMSACKVSRKKLNSFSGVEDIGKVSLHYPHTLCIHMRVNPTCRLEIWGSANFEFTAGTTLPEYKTKIDYIICHRVNVPTVKNHLFNDFRVTVLTRKHQTTEVVLQNKDNNRTEKF
jgi:hypothetical protein